MLLKTEGQQLSTNEKSNNRQSKILFPSIKDLAQSKVFEVEF